MSIFRKKKVTRETETYLYTTVSFQTNLNYVKSPVADD